MQGLDQQAFDPMSPAFRADPYPFYTFLRQFAPVFEMPGWGMWFLTRYDDAVMALRDPRFGHGPGAAEGHYEGPESQRALREMESRWVLVRNPPDHTRLKGLVHKAFTPRVIEALRGRVEQTANGLIDAVEAKGSLDLIEDYAFPLPVTVISQMLGVPTSDQELFKTWSRGLAGTLDINDQAEVYDRGSKVTEEISAYLKKLIDERRRNPQDDLMTALIAAEEQGDRLNEQEMIANLILLLVAGHETTQNLIGNGTLALLRHPDQMAMLRSAVQSANGSAATMPLMKTAVEELLRYDSPVQFTSRVTFEDVEIGGQIIPRGSAVGTMLGAANRDPARFSDADQLDITRADNPHMAFGNGIHYCLGAPLARMEGGIAFATLLRRLPNLKLATDAPEYRETYVLRGLKSLPLTF
jgi:pimeloyl-[acyl-carrier protein] synthase